MASVLRIVLGVFAGIYALVLLWFLVAVFAYSGGRIDNADLGAARKVMRFSSFSFIALMIIFHWSGIV